MQLTTEQLAQFDKDGFIVLRKFLDVRSCDDILEVAKRHPNQHIEPIETELGYAEGSKEKRTQETDYSSSYESVKVVRRLRQVYEQKQVFWFCVTSSGLGLDLDFSFSSQEVLIFGFLVLFFCLKFCNLFNQKINLPVQIFIFFCFCCSHHCRILSGK